MSDPLEIPGEVWDEEYYPDLPLNVCFWRRGPPEIVYDDEEVPEQEFAFEEGSVSITVNYLLKAYRAHQDSVREERRAVTDTAVEQGEFVLHRPPDEDVHVPLTRGAFADVSTYEYNFVRGYILHSAARFWQEHLPDWRRVVETQSLVYYFFNIETGSDAFWDFTFRYIPGDYPEVEAFVVVPLFHYASISDLISEDL